MYGFGFFFYCFLAIFGFLWKVSKNRVKTR
jgi:hypothetical protein